MCIPLNIIRIQVLVTGIVFYLTACPLLHCPQVHGGKMRKNKADTEDCPRVQMNHDLCRIP